METRFVINDGELKRYFGNEPKIVIPSDVKKIGKRAFDNSDVEVVEFEKNSQLKEIDDYAFYMSEKLRGVVLPDGLLRIGSHAFEGCSSMSYLVIPNSVIEIGADAIKDTQSILAILSNGNKEAEKIAEKEWVPYITNVNATLRKIRDREQRASNVGAREFNIKGTTLTLTNSARTFNEVVNHYSSKGQDLYKAFFNTIPSTISESNVEKYADQFKDALDREIKQVYERLSSQGIYLREGKLEGMAASAMKPVMELRNAIMNFRSALVEDANTEIHDAVERNKRWISSQITGLTYGMIGSTADLLLYSIDDYITKEKQKKAAYSTADAQFIKEYNTIISKYDEFLKAQLDDVEDTIEKGTYQIIDKLGKIESMLLTKVGLIDLKHIDQEIAAGTIRRMKTMLESKEQKSSDIMRKISSSTSDHSVELGIAIKNNPYNIDAYCYAIRNDCCIESVMEMIDFLDISKDVALSLNYENKNKFKEKFDLYKSKCSSNSKQISLESSNLLKEKPEEKVAEGKIADETEEKQTIQTAPIVGININPNNVEPTITRIELFLEDEEWNKAIAYAEAGLDYFPTDYRLYLLLLCAKRRAGGINELEDSALLIQDDPLFKKVKRFITPEGMQEYGYLFDVDNLQKYTSAKKLASENQYENAIELLSAISGYKDSDTLLIEYKNEKEAEEKRLIEEEKKRIAQEKEAEERRKKEAEEREKHTQILYEKAVSDYENAETLVDYEKCRDEFFELKDYKDSEQYRGRVRNKIKNLQTEEIIKQTNEHVKSASTVSDYERILRPLYEKRYELNLGQTISELEEKRDFLKYEDTYKRLIEKYVIMQDPSDAENLIREFGMLRGYKDSQKYAVLTEKKRKDLLCEKKYKEAVAILDKDIKDSNEAEIRRAMTMLSSIEGYKDSLKVIEIAKEKKKESIYVEGKQLLTNAKKLDSLEYAKNLFTRLSDYKDSKQIAERLVEINEQYKAIAVRIGACSNDKASLEHELKKLGLFDRKRKKEIEEKIKQKIMELDGLEKEKLSLLSDDVFHN